MKTIKKLIKICISGILSIFILSIFVLFYNYTGIHISNSSGSTDYKWSSNQIKSTMVEGFSWLRMDEKGFNNSSSYNGNPDILLMGSSHMEATEIAKNENVGYLLNIELPHMTTYNIGMSGHDIYRCVKNLKCAVQEFNPNSYIIIETDTVNLTSEDINKVLLEEMEPIKSYDSGLMYVLQKYCPSVKTLYKQITDWRSLNRLKSNDTENITEAKDYEYYEFVKKMKVDSGDNATLIVFYQPAYRIDENGELLLEETGEGINHFAQACENNNVVFINMTERFRELYYQHNVLAHGFSNTAVGIGHLNKYGHEAIADVLVEFIKGDMR